MKTTSIATAVIGIWPIGFESLSAQATGAAASLSRCAEEIGHQSRYSSSVEPASRRGGSWERVREFGLLPGNARRGLSYFRQRRLALV
jgi:hypothetical protein